MLIKLSGFFTSFTILTIVAPNITMAPIDRTIVEPNTVSFTCDAEGFPRPNIVWFIQHDGISIQLSNDTAVTITTINGSGDRQVTSTLTVASVRPPLAGMYICNASNVVDDDAQDATLIVHSKCLHLLVMQFLHCYFRLCSCS